MLVNAFVLGTTLHFIAQLLVLVLLFGEYLLFLVSFHFATASLNQEIYSNVVMLLLKQLESQIVHIYIPVTFVCH